MILKLSGDKFGVLFARRSRTGQLANNIGKRWRRQSRDGTGGIYSQDQTIQQSGGRTLLAKTNEAIDLHFDCGHSHFLANQDTCP